MENFERPAYPTNGRMHSEMTGLTKREMFAMAAMQGLLSNAGYTQGLEANYKNNVITDMNAMAAREAIDMADQLLKQLETPTE